MSLDMKHSLLRGVQDLAILALILFSVLDVDSREPLAASTSTVTFDFFMNRDPGANRTRFS